MQTKFQDPKKRNGFTLVEIILVIVIIGIVITMVSNPSLLKQNETATVQHITSNLLGFMDQRKLDSFLGKKIGDMHIQKTRLILDPENTNAILTIEYSLLASRTQETFEKLLPQDSNISYFFHHDDFRCKIDDQQDFSLTLVC